jgi:hypothetical protein
MLRNEWVPSTFGLIPKSIVHLEEKLDVTNDRKERAAIFVLLVKESSRVDNDELYLCVLRRRAAEFSDDPISLGGLAFGIAAMRPIDKVDAANAAKNALEVARQADRLVRYSATNAIRVGLMIDDYDLIDKALEVLLTDEAKHRSEDTPYEFDFLTKIDENRCTMSLLRRYQNLNKD